MKAITAILLCILVLFLVQPIAASKVQPAGDSCCSSPKKSKKQTTQTADCNPFVNCCYRTFEVTGFINIKKPVTLVRKPVYTEYNVLEPDGYSSLCWHPPQGLPA